MEEKLTTTIQFSHVGVTLNGKSILHDINLSACAGEVLTLTGPSGTGKTTLMRLAAGLLQPGVGGVQRRFVRVGAAFQSPRLLPWRTVLQNVTLPMARMGLGREESVRRARNLLTELGIGETMRKWPLSLSGGMAHRVSLARALAVEPDLLLLDEPMTGLDHHSKENALSVVQNYLQEHSALCLYITHHIEETVEFSNRIITLTPSGGMTEDTHHRRTS